MMGLPSSSPEGEISYTGQVGTLADITAKYDYATANVVVESVTNGQINVSGPPSFLSKDRRIQERKLYTENLPDLSLPIGRGCFCRSCSLHYISKKTAKKFAYVVISSYFCSA